MRHPTPGELLELHFGELDEARGAAVPGARPRLRRVRRRSRRPAVDRAALLAGLPADAPPADGLERVLARIETVRPARERRAHWLRTAAPCAAARPGRLRGHPAGRRPGRPRVLRPGLDRDPRDRARAHPRVAAEVLVTTKKKLITRMALGAATVLAVALLTGGAALALLHSDRERWEYDQKREREQVVERSRKYLGRAGQADREAAGRPDARRRDRVALLRGAGERARCRSGPWGRSGEFLFGVPKESFSRLNAVYDREVTPRLKEGVFFDRQSFLLGHLDEGEDLVLAGDLAGDAEESRRPPGAAPPARRRTRTGRSCSRPRSRRPTASPSAAST